MPDFKPITYDESFTNYFHPVVLLLDAGAAIERNQQFRFMWTPDGKRIVYGVQQQGQALGSIYSAGTTFRTVATGVLSPASTNVDLSADGEAVVFVTSEGLTTAPIEGTYSYRVLVEGPLKSPRWSPDDRYIAFVGDTGIGIVPWNGGVTQFVPDTSGAASLAWVPLP